MKYYFLGCECKSVLSKGARTDTDAKNGRVLKYILNNAYETIIGLDIGHGETIVYIYRKDDTGVWQQMVSVKLADREHIIPSYIFYEEAEDELQVSIGNAAKGGDFSYSFKQEPGRWYSDWESRSAAEKIEVDRYHHSCDELLHDFIGKLVDQAKEQDTVVKTALGEIRKDNTLIVVGCPAAEEWTSDESIRKYRNLIHKATGHPVENIAVFPEPTAAILSVVYNRIMGGDAVPNLSKGVVICDAGSSTLDITYILLGEVLYTASLPVAGSDIEEAMYQKILQDHGNPFIPMDQRNSIMAQLRTDKEDFYKGGQKEIPRQITVKRGDGVYEKYDFLLNKTFMEDVLGMKGFIHIGDAAYDGRDWMDCCDKFFEKTRARIGEKPISAVVLTGGTGNVVPLQECFRKYYGDFEKEKNTADSVAKGLCYAKSLETNAAELIDPALKDLQEKHERRYQKEFLPDLAEQLFRKEAEIIGDALKQLHQEKNQKQQKHSREELQQAADAAIRKEQQEIETVFKKVFEDHAKNCIEDVIEKANALSKKVYQTELAGSPQLNTANMQVPENIGNQLKLEKLFKINMFSYVVHAFKSLLRRKDPDWEHKECLKIIGAYITENGREELCRKHSKALKKELKNLTQMKRLYDEMNLEQFEIALGKVLLLVTDECQR